MKHYVRRWGPWQLASRRKEGICGLNPQIKHATASCWCHLANRNKELVDWQQRFRLLPNYIFTCCRPRICCDPLTLISGVMTPPSAEADDVEDEAWDWWKIADSSRVCAPDVACLRLIGRNDRLIICPIDWSIDCWLVECLTGTRRVRFSGSFYRRSGHEGRGVRLRSTSRRLSAQRMEYSRFYNRRCRVSALQ